MGGRSLKVIVFVLAVAVLVAGVWWAIVMPDRFVYPAEGPPILENSLVTRLALGALSVVFAVALGMFAHLIPTDLGMKDDKGAEPRGRSS